jgi:hypothetical protein
MAEREVGCVVLRQGSRDHQAIALLGGNVDGEMWVMTRAEVAGAITGHVHQFFVRGRFGRLYLDVYDGDCVQTQVNGRWTDDLLHLPECVAD